jgi:hypothetical protein
MAFASAGLGSNTGATGMVQSNGRCCEMVNKESQTLESHIAYWNDNCEMIKTHWFILSWRELIPLLIEVFEKVFEYGLKPGTGALRPGTVCTGY